MIYLVILFWLCVVGYIPYHFRNTEPAQHFRRAVGEWAEGFAACWKAAVTATAPPNDTQPPEPYMAGFMCAVGSMIGTAVMVLAFAIYTIWICR